MPVAIALASSAVLVQLPFPDHYGYWKSYRGHAAVDAASVTLKSDLHASPAEMAPTSHLPDDLPEVCSTLPDDLEDIEPSITPDLDLLSSGTIQQCSREQQVFVSSLEQYLPQDINISTAPEIAKIPFKEEPLSPTERYGRYTGPVGSIVDLAVPSSSSYTGPHSSSDTSPTIPVIPLTALALCEQDSSDSSETDDLPHPGTSASSDKVNRDTVPSPRARGATREATRERDAGLGKVLDRRKRQVSVSDPADSDESDEGDGTEEDRSDMDRLERRRLSNRVAAQRCRQRQRQHYRGLTKEIQDWECKNTSLKYEVRQLQKELKQLQGELSAHEAVCTRTDPK